EREAGWLGSSAKVAREPADRLTVRTGAIALAGGNKPHVAACTAWPDGDAGWLAIIAQPCFPPRLQQAGSLESPSEANTAGAIGEKLKSATSSIASLRRIAVLYSNRRPPPRDMLRRCSHGTAGTLPSSFSLGEVGGDPLLLSPGWASCPVSSRNAAPLRILSLERSSQLSLHTPPARSANGRHWSRSSGPMPLRDSARPPIRPAGRSTAIPGPVPRRLRAPLHFASAAGGDVPWPPATLRNRPTIAYRNGARTRGWGRSKGPDGTRPWPTRDS